ncbi:MAG: type ISP restriction/modification enzyme [Lentisphaerota bacterium]
MPINEYIKQVKQSFVTGISTEHSYRPALKNLLDELVKGIIVTNEPKRQKCGAPDYIIQRKQVPIGYIEAKDIGIDLGKTEKSDQMSRYLKSLDNLILTDYLEFRFYRYGQKVKEIKIASIEEGKLKVHPENFSSFETYINDFCSFKGQTIKSAEKLAKMMAQKARMMEEVLFNAVKEVDENNSLKDQLEAFRRVLIHDLDEKTFADIYAQTIAYGLFAARLHDKTLDTFSRQEARELIPRSNPFLRSLFDYVSGAELDDRVVWIVDDLSDIFRATDLKAILSDFGKATEQTDPFIHFYETFLAEYDPKLRKSRGVYYTPEPVVNFIVRAVDDILKSDFNLPLGLADTSKIKIKRTVEGTAITKGKDKGKDVIEEVEVHKVQILDPATGTGTFLAQVVKQIYGKFKGQQGIWSNYVDEHLIPRLNGFEILMASYTICHLKIEMLLRETGYKAVDENKQKRLRVFLTNSLEEAHPDTGTLFASWLSRESTEANYVKKETPVMVILGNPPYSVSSSNKSEWIQNLIADYKKDLNERKINLDDDYIKFIRFGQHFIDKNGEGILALISNNSFIDGITHRQMRKHLLESFDKIYILDLHGNSKKKETAPDGTKDENVFDIQQGVSINIFVKSKNGKMGINHFDLYGKREVKYRYLNDNRLSNIKWSMVKEDNDNCFFTSKDLLTGNSYLKYISLSELLPLNNSGIQTKCDSISINQSIEKLQNTVALFQTEPIEKLKSLFAREESSGWNFAKAKDDLIKNTSFVYAKYNYRPFDFRNIVYTGSSSGFLGRSRSVVMKHFIKRDNIGLCLMRQFFQDAPYSHIYATNSLIDERTMYSNRGGTYLFPLYLYPDEGSFDTSRKPNLNLDIVKQIADKLGMTFTAEKTMEGLASSSPLKVVLTKQNPPASTPIPTFSPIDILDYIYAVLHSPSYREKYKEFLKIDFPRVPYPEDAKTFWKLVKLGGELRQIHLLESPVVENFITSYPISGDNKVGKVRYENSRVYINETQYFDNVPEVAWSFYIGGYQPAQKWLKDRKERVLNFDDILHYQKIIVALTETARIMKEIDEVK